MIEANSADCGEGESPVSEVAAPAHSFPQEGHLCPAPASTGRRPPWTQLQDAEAWGEPYRRTESLELGPRQARWESAALSELTGLPRGLHGDRDAGCTAAQEPAGALTPEGSGQSDPEALHLPAESLGTCGQWARCTPNTGLAPGQKEGQQPAQAQAVLPGVPGLDVRSVNLVRNEGVDTAETVRWDRPGTGLLETHSTMT